MAAKKQSDPKICDTTLSEWKELLTSTDQQEQEFAAWRLNNLNKRAVAAFPLLVELLGHQDPAVQANVLSLLARLVYSNSDKIGSAALDSLPALQKLLRSKDSTVRYNAFMVVSGIGTAAESAASLLGKILLSAKKADESHLASAIIKLGPAAVPILISTIRNSRSVNLRGFAAHGLGQLGPAAAAAVPELLLLLKDKWPAQNFATMALGDIAAEPKTVVPALITMIDDKEHEVRRSAVTSLGKFGPAAAAAIPKILPFLESKDWEWWHFLASEALARIGPAAKEALPALQKLLTSKNRQIREEAQNAINLISQKPISPAVAKQRQKPAPGDNVFDFARTKKVVSQMLKDGIARFAKEHPEEEVACVALFGRGFSSFAYLCIGTPAEVPADLKTGGAYDFKYSEYGTEEFEWWPDLYQVGSSFVIKLPDGKLQKRSTDKSGNDAIDKPLFDLLKEVMTEALPFKKLKQAKGFRVGVEMHDSALIKFWKPAKS